MLVSYAIQSDFDDIVLSLLLFLVEKMKRKNINKKFFFNIKYNNIKIFFNIKYFLI